MVEPKRTSIAYVFSTTEGVRVKIERRVLEDILWRPGLGLLRGLSLKDGTGVEV